MRINSMREAARNRALHSTAQASAISSTISEAAMRWRESVLRMGLMSISVPYRALICSAGSMRLARNAGNMPAATVVRTEVAKVKASIFMSSCIMSA
ncbi:hypothetical protein D3C81_1727420 [compost metagenome]